MLSVSTAFLFACDNSQVFVTVLWFASGIPRCFFSYSSLYRSELHIFLEGYTWQWYVVFVLHLKFYLETLREGRTMSRSHSGPVFAHSV